MSKDQELEFQKIPNEKYAKFFEKFKDIEVLDVKEWKPAHILGYFCKRYKEKYKVDYSWKFNNQLPSKSYEVWQINTLSVKLSSDPQTLKDYIDWVFDHDLSQLKKRFTALSFLTKEDRMINYKNNYLFNNNKSTIKRITVLPISYKNVFAGINKPIETYGDLSFLALDKSSDDVRRAFEQIKMLGFDDKILENIV